MTKTCSAGRSLLGLGALALLGTGVLAAEPRRSIRFDHVTGEQGLSQPNVMAILQDRVGFMWFGTQAGLNRYDGVEMAVYRHDPGDPASLSHNLVYALSEDPSGDLWIGTVGGGLGSRPWFILRTILLHRLMNPVRSDHCSWT